VYFIGAELTGKTGFASMILMERVRKDLKKYYHVLDIKRFHFNSDANDLLEEIARRYNDARYTIRKPRFSQIGRPKKIVNEKPLIFITCCDESLKWMNGLKQNKIPAHCVFLTDQNDWRTEIPGKCLKSDFYVPKKNLINNILAVIEQDRLIMAKKEAAGEVLEAFNKYRKMKDVTLHTQDVKPLDDLVLALAMPVWYYEHLLSIRPRTP